MAAIIPIILALISYFAAKKSGASNGTAALTGAAVGAGAYYVTTQTDWGKSLVGDLNGSTSDSTAGSTPGTGSSTMPSWLVPAGTALVGAGAGAALADKIPSWAWLAGGGLLLYMVLK